MNKDNLLGQYRHIAAPMEALRGSTVAQIRYHMLADALYWSDEIPSALDPLSENCLRPVLRYRTTLILGAPDHKWKPYWDEAMRQFPRWIGFDAARADARLGDLFLEIRAAAHAESFGAKRAGKRGDKRGGSSC